MSPRNSRANVEHANVRMRSDLTRATVVSGIVLPLRASSTPPLQAPFAPVAAINAEQPQDGDPSPLLSPKPSPSHMAFRVRNRAFIQG